MYTINKKQYLRRYLDDGHLSIDNTAAKRAIKNFAVGRRNWLFSKSIKGAEASVTVYSITKTAILNGLKPYDYLTYILGKMKYLAPFPTKEDILPFYCSGQKQYRKTVVSNDQKAHPLSRNC